MTTTDLHALIVAAHARRGTSVYRLAVDAAMNATQLHRYLDTGKGLSLESLCRVMTALDLSVVPI